MRAVLMAGGEGTRLRPLTCDLPKPMVPILNRPIAEHIINLLRRHNITDIIATLFYLPDVFRDYFQDGFDLGVKLTYAVEEELALGTAGCVKNVAPLLNDTFLVISADSLTDFDLSAAIAFHRQRHSKATLVLARVPNPMEFGVVMTDRQGRIQRFLEKPASSEIFSDTVNTGIYILEPEVLNYLPAQTSTDFSTDLFPLLLERGYPMYGYVAEGYWRDIGSLDQYREAQYDALHSKVCLDMAYPERQHRFWIGENTLIDAEAQIHPPVLIGGNCRIGARAILTAGTVLGDNVIVGAKAVLERSIVWNGAIIGEEAHLRACAIARGARVDRRGRVLDGAVIGALSTVGEEAQVSAGIRVWPSKRIEAGATLNINLVWGNTAQRHLFGQQGVSGLANVDITAEFAVRLGAAYASTLTPGSQVMVSRDQRSISRMVSRSLVSGLMSVGIQVQNLEAIALPISRCAARTLGVSGGIHTRIHPERPDFVLIEFFDDQGINLSKTKEKKIEGAFFKEDFRRATISDIGDITYPSQTLNAYASDFEKLLNIAGNSLKPFKVVVDYVYAVSGAVLPHLLSKFGCDVVVLNASLRQSIPSIEEREELLGQLGAVVKALKANLGVQVSANGERFILVDDEGTAIHSENLTALMVDISLRANPHQIVVVPAHVSSAVDEIARRYGGQAIRTKVNPTALMETCRKNLGVVLGGSAETGFIFPQLHPGFDAMFAIAKLIEMLTLHRQTLQQLMADLPQIHYQTLTVRCPWNQKGRLMRNLVEIYPIEQIELIDGVKIKHPTLLDHWILVLPDADEPLVHLIANGKDRNWVTQMLQDCRGRIQTLEALEGAINADLEASGV
ncbi:sugar phosphate nucleotidyltransferase [Altericista sp. CCNU0014]|uniref:sugar phosphate nucleotidyltransferase n=1 Tax=Altericista sp. CCNU0014 TaxID=3082949 RepID=UPI00384E75E1